jgi:hypothetical protein
MGLKDTFFRVLVGNNTTDNDIKKSAEVAEQALAKAEQPEIEKVEDIEKTAEVKEETLVVETAVKPILETEITTVGVTTVLEPQVQVTENNTAEETAVTEESLPEVKVEETVEVNTEEVTENTAESVEIEKPVETVAEEVDAAEGVNETVENIVEPVIAPEVDTFENIAVGHDTETVRIEETPEEIRKLDKLEEIVVDGVLSIFRRIKEELRGK